MEISKAISVCIKQGIKVYPEILGNSFIVEVNQKGVIKKGKIKHTSKTINEAITKTYILIAEKIKQNV